MNLHEKIKLVEGAVKEGYVGGFAFCGLIEDCIKKLKACKIKVADSQEVRSLITHKDGIYNESREKALRGWRRMSEGEKETTRRVYKIFNKE